MAETEFSTEETSRAWEEFLLLGARGCDPPGITHVGLGRIRFEERASNPTEATDETR